MPFHAVVIVAIVIASPFIALSSRAMDDVASSLNLAPPTLKSYTAGSSDLSTAGNQQQSVNGDDEALTLVMDRTGTQSTKTANDAHSTILHLDNNQRRQKDSAEIVGENLFEIKGLNKIDGIEQSDGDAHQRLPKSYDKLILEEFENDLEKHSRNNPSSFNDDEDNDEDDEDSVRASVESEGDQKVDRSVLTALFSGGLASPEVLFGILLFVVISSAIYYVARRAYLNHRMLSKALHSYTVDRKQRNEQKTYREGYSEIPSPSIAEIASRQV